jgi:hypothetical protein
MNPKRLFVAFILLQLIGLSLWLTKTRDGRSVLKLPAQIEGEQSQGGLMLIATDQADINGLARGMITTDDNEFVALNRFCHPSDTIVWFDAQSLKKSDREFTASIKSPDTSIFPLDCQQEHLNSQRTTMDVFSVRIPVSYLGSWSSGDLEVISKKSGQRLALWHVSNLPAMH